MDCDIHPQETGGWGGKKDRDPKGYRDYYLLLTD